MIDRYTHVRFYGVTNLVIAMNDTSRFSDTAGRVLHSWILKNDGYVESIWEKIDAPFQRFKAITLR